MFKGRFGSNYFTHLSERESFFILIKLIFDNYLEPVNANSIYEERAKLFDDFLDSLQHPSGENFTKSEKINLASKLAMECREQRFKSDDFNWLNSKDDIQCSWAWNYLKNFININNPSPYEQLLSTHMKGTVSPTNTADRYISTIDRIDRDNFCSGKLQKEAYMESIKSAWGHAFAMSKLHSWIDRNNEVQVSWAWDHLPNKLITPNLKPLTTEECYLAIVGKILSWSNTSYELELMISKAKKAWSQKKHRDSKVGTKTYSFSLSIEAKSKLDSIAKAKDKKLNATLEGIIIKEFERINQT
jgi:hypothetical protein